MFNTKKNSREQESKNDVTFITFDSFVKDNTILFILLPTI